MDSVVYLVFLIRLSPSGGYSHFAYCLIKTRLSVRLFYIGLSSFSLRKRSLPFLKRAFVRIVLFGKQPSFLSQLVERIPCISGIRSTLPRRRFQRDRRELVSFTKVIQFSEWVVGPFIGEASCLGLSEGSLGSPFSPLADWFLGVLWVFQGFVGPWDRQREIEYLLYKSGLSQWTSPESSSLGLVQGQF